MYRILAIVSYVFVFSMRFAYPNQMSMPALLAVWFILWLIGCAADNILKELARASEKGE